jgi:S-formylglutathione hydrolase
MELTESHRSSGGEQRRYQHHAETLNCEMHFSLYLPPEAETRRVPVLFWLSGLTCDDQNFVTKAGAQRWAAEQGVAILAPDTSPRGQDVADDPDGAYDFGLGAGFYVNATQPPYASHYRMYDYVAEELPELMRTSFPMLADRTAISGHSMGGHGALTIALRNPDRYTSVSAFAPICAPASCPWGEKALAGYLGADREVWAAHDASLLIAEAERLPMRIDQGGADDFLIEQLKPERLLDAAAKAEYPIDYHLHDGYDHSYFFIASFIDQHLEFHARHLGAG